MARYLSGLCVASVGLCAAGWLLATGVLVDAESRDARLVSLGTGTGVAVISLTGIACWSVAWRQRMRRDGVLAPPARTVSPAQARRYRRTLRRDMRRAARRAHEEAPGMRPPVPPQRPTASPEVALSDLRALLEPLLVPAETPDVRREPVPTADSVRAAQRGTSEHKRGSGEPCWVHAVSGDPVGAAGRYGENRCRVSGVEGGGAPWGDWEEWW